MSQFMVIVTWIMLHNGDSHSIGHLGGKLVFNFVCLMLKDFCATCGSDVLNGSDVLGG